MFDWSRFELIKLNPLVITITKTYLWFNKSIIEKMSCEYVVFYVNEKEKQIAIKKCNKNNKYAHRFTSRWNGDDLMNILNSLIDTDERPLRICGKFYPEDNAIIFKLNGTRC